MLDPGVRAGVIAVALDAAVGSWSARPGLDRTRFGGHRTRLLQFLSTGD
jgi:hypothetical protein